jgi:hypothetical protein
MIVLAMSLGSQAIAQEVPNILKGLDVKFDKDDKEFVIYDDDVDILIERTSSFQLVDKREDEDSILIIKKDDNVEVTISVLLGTEDIQEILKSASVSFTS